MDVTVSEHPATLATSRPVAMRARTWNPRRIVLFMVLLLAPLLAAEVGVRLLIGMDRLPAAATHDQSVDLMWLNLERAGNVELLLVGDSITHSGIDPAVLGELASDALRRPVKAFSFAAPGTGPGTSALLVEELARQGRLPSVVVVGISPVSLRGTGSGDRAFRSSPMGRLLTRCEGVEGYADLADCWLGQVSALWQWRGRPGPIVNAIRRSRWTQGSGRRRLLRTDGFAEGPPRSVAEIERQVRTGLAHEPESLELGRSVPDDYRELVDALQRNGVTVVPVLIPYSPPYAAALEERHPGFEAEMQAAAEALGTATGVPVIDPGPFGTWWGDGSSQNIKHLSREGAVDFTRQLWETPGVRDGLLAGLADPES
jgi:hypothetical protein